ncbi:MAG: hypothetical protein KDD02_17715 [Phaeodactylibacter sp.]|nr:hypothetical protein [Phaeodactylibacter sp.]
MKSFSGILLLGLILCTILAPCADGVVMVLEKNSKEHETACCQASAEKERDLSGGESQSQEIPGHCSPLCHCCCCGQVASVHGVSFPIPLEVEAALHQPVFIGVYDFEYSHHIWQPPRQA